MELKDRLGRPRTVVTGIGVVSALGVGTKANKAALRSVVSGIGPITRFDSADFNCRIAGEVPDANSLRVPNVDLFAGFALAAAEESLETMQGKLDPDRTGVVVGSALGGSESLDDSYLRFYGKRATRLAPLTIPNIMYNAAASAISTRFGFRGPSMATVSACASSAHAICQALLWIRSGMADAVLAGGADAPLTPGIVRAWEALRVLSGDNDSPESASKPFSADRSGLVLAEGAAILVIESLESALNRDAPILAEIAGIGVTSDAAHLTTPQVEGAASAMRIALSDAGIRPDEVDYVNAHGTGTRLNDKVETRAIHAAFGSHAPNLAISSTKSQHGHAMGASGAIEAGLTILSANDGFMPATANLNVPDPECDLDYIPLTPRIGSPVFAISSSFAFGGMNVVIGIRPQHAIEEAAP